MKIKVLATIISSICIATSCNVYAGEIYPNPRAVPADVYQEPYREDQFTTTYAPWLKNFHMMNQAELESGRYGGEAMQQIRQLEMSPVDSNVLYLVTDTTGVYKTTDGGQQWYSVNNNIARDYGYGLLCDKFDVNTVYCYIAQDGAYKSVDGGKTWIHLFDDISSKRITTSNRIAKDGNGNVIFGGSNGIYFLKKGKEDVINLYPEYENFPGNGVANFTDVAVSEDGKDIYLTGTWYSGCTSSYKSGLYISHDNGKSWKIKNIYEDGVTSGESVCIDPDNQNHILVYSTKYDEAQNTKIDFGLFESFDGGETFEKIYVLTDGENERIMRKVRFGALKPDGTRDIYGVGNEITFPLRKSTDGGKTFEKVYGYTATGTFREHPDSKGYTGWYSQPYALDYSNPDRLFFAAAGVHEVNNGEVIWRSSGFSGCSVNFIAMDKEGNFVLTITDTGTAISEKPYTKQGDHATFTITNEDIMTMIAIDPNNSKHIIAYSGNDNTSKESLGIVESYDGGKTYSPIIKGSESKTNTMVLQYDVENPNIIYSSECISRDNGKTWEPTEYFLYAVSKKNPNVMIGKTEQNKEPALMITKDGGKTWEFLMQVGYTFQQAEFDIDNEDILWYSHIYHFGYINLRTKEIVDYKNKFIFNEFHYFAQNPNNANHIVLRSRPWGDRKLQPYDGKAYETVDGGKTWTIIPGLWGSLFQKPVFSTTSEEVFLPGHSGTFIYDYNKFWDYQNSKIKILLNSKEVYFSVAPEFKGETAMVPVREFLEKSLGSGFTISWHQEEQKVTIKSDLNTIEFSIGKDIGLINGDEVRLDNVPYIKKGSTMVPIVFISTSLDINAGWNSIEKLIAIKSKGGN